MNKAQLIASARSAVAQLLEGTEHKQYLFAATSGGLSPDQAKALWEYMEGAGLLAAVEATHQPAAYAEVYSGWRSHRGMIGDRSRTGAFRRAIEALVRPGMHVADVGAGSGILSLFAARAGAARVHALEATSICAQSRQVAEANGFADRIDFVQGDASVFVSSEPLDIVLGEWAGTWLFEEWRHLDALARVRDRNLKPGGCVLPAAATVFLAPIDDSRLYVHRGPGFWERPVWGFDFSLVHRQQLDRTRRIVVQADPRTLLDRYELLHINCAHEDSRALFVQRQFETTFTHAATCHGLIGWFSLHLAPGVELETSPDQMDTHWHQSYFPFEQMQIQAGDRFCVDAAIVPDPLSGSPVLDLDIRLIRAQSVVTRCKQVYTLDDTQG